MSGKPAARVGDKVAGNVIVSGSATVLIGDAGQGCADKACKGSPSVGSPVNPMLGIKVLPGETDFALAAPSPFVFTRSYASDDARIGPLGQGWSIPGASLYLEVSETATVVVDPQGRRITFDALAPGESLFSPSESLWIRRGGPVSGEGAPPPKAWDGRWIGVPEAVQRDPNAIVSMSVSGNDAFVFLAGPTRWRLAQVVDRNSYSTEYQWSATGDLRAIRDSAGRVYALVYAAHQTTLEGDSGLRLAGVVLAFDPGRDDKPRSTFDPLAKDNDWLVRYGYDAEGDLVEVIDRMGQSVRYFGYRQHIMVRHGQPGGIDVRYTYDTYSPQGKVLTQRNLEGLDYSFEYHRDRTVVTDSLGRVETYHFAGEAGLRRVVKQVRADGSLVERKYDYAGRLTAVVDPMGRVTRFRLDGEGRELGKTLPDGTTESIAYDSQTGDFIEKRDALGRRLLIERDVRGNPVLEIKPDGAVTRYIYGCNGLPDRPIQVIDAGGGVKHVDWNRLGQQASYTDCSGYTTRYSYDCDGNQTGVMNALGQITHHEYDRIGRPVAVIQPDGAVVRNTRDALGRVISIIDPLGHVTKMRYDRFGRVSCYLDPLQYSQRFCFDEAGRLIKVFNQNNVCARFEHDLMDRLILEVGFDGRERKYCYAQNGELMNIIEAGGLVTRFERDLLGRMTALHVPAVVASAEFSCFYVYDAAGQLIEAKSPDVAVSIKYDLAGRVISEVQRHSDGWQYHQGHRYNALGVREASKYDGAPEIKWLTYGSGYLHGVRVGDYGFDFERDVLHREVRRSALYAEKATGLELIRNYDAGGRLISQRVTSKWQDVVDDWLREYNYDAMGQLVRTRDGQSGVTDYFYDPNGRLSRSCHAGMDFYYLFDPAGNRIDALVDGEVNAVVSNRVERLHGVEYKYDLAGNVIERVCADGGRLEMDYDGLHRLVKLRRRSGVGCLTAQYKYDAFGRRVHKHVDVLNGIDLNEYYGWDGDRLIASENARMRSMLVYESGSFFPLMQMKGRNDSGGVDECRLIMAQAGVPVEKMGEYEWGARLIATDGVGTALRMTEFNGDVCWCAEQEDWSAVKNAGDAVPGFVGQHYDHESGLYYNRHRYYDGISGFYLSQDPVGFSAGLNFYAYASLNPVSISDPLGLCDVMCSIAMRNAGLSKDWQKTWTYTPPPPKSGCREVCEDVGAVVCSIGVEVGADAAIIGTGGGGGVGGAAIWAGKKGAEKICNKGGEKVCKWVCDPPPEKLANPTNDFGKPGGCGDYRCLMYK